MDNKMELTLEFAVQLYEGEADGWSEYDDRIYDTDEYDVIYHVTSYYNSKLNKYVKIDYMVDSYPDIYYFYIYEVKPVVRPMEVFDIIGDRTKL